MFSKVRTSIGVAALSLTLSFGLLAFTPTAFGCGTQGGAGNCKKMSESGSPIDALARFRWIVLTIDALLP